MCGRLLWGEDVVKPRKPFMMKPAMMHFISEIPLPAAYGANDLTRNADVKANRTLQSALKPNIQTKRSKVPRKNKEGEGEDGEDGEDTANRM